jgi:hypothetical protein
MPTGDGSAKPSSRDSSGHAARRDMQRLRQLSSVAKWIGNSVIHAQPSQLKQATYLGNRRNTPNIRDTVEADIPEARADSRRTGATDHPFRLRG